MTLSEDELLGFIEFKKLDGSLAYCFDKDNPPSCSRCKFNPCTKFEDAIVALIKDWHAYIERAKEADKELTEAGLKIASGQLIKKPKVTEEWIEEKARVAWNLWWYKASGKYVADFTGTIRFDFQGVKNLIRSLVEEIQCEK